MRNSRLCATWRDRSGCRWPAALRPWKGEQSGAVTRLADDLPLFAAAPARPTGRVARAVESEVEKAVATINPDELTPKQALELLYELRRLKS